MTCLSLLEYAAAPRFAMIEVNSPPAGRFQGGRIRWLTAEGEAGNAHSPQLVTGRAPETGYRDRPWNSGEAPVHKACAGHAAAGGAIRPQPEPGQRPSPVRTFRPAMLGS